MGETYNLRTSLPITSTNWNGCCVRKSHRDIENMFEYTDDCHTAFTRRTIRAAAKVKLRRYICRVRRLANKIESKQSIYRFDKRSYDEALGMCHHSELQRFKKCSKIVRGNEFEPNSPSSKLAAFLNAIYHNVPFTE